MKRLRADYIWGMLATIRFSLLSSRLLSRNVKVKIYKTIILPVVLYGGETWSLMLREDHRLMVFENRVLRRIFGPKRDEVTREWRKLHNEDLHNLNSSPDIISQVKANEVGRECSTHGRGEKSVQGFGGKSRRKDTTWKTKAKWEDGIRMDLREIGMGVWIGFDWLRTGTGGGLW
jgi:hypothetical protein